MASLKKTLFISDLHLDEADAESYCQFKDFIASVDSSVDALYILGDFFETWIGDDNRTSFYDSIIALLQSVRAKNIPLYFMHGNRDFLVGKKFLQQVDATLLSDETRVSVYGTPVLLMHGDTLCTEDHTYLFARKILRNRFLQFLLFNSLPLSLRKKMAIKMRNTSKRYTASVSTYLMDVTQQEVVRVMQKNEVRLLIHGHTHRPAFHQFNVNDEVCMRIVLGAWHPKASVLVWHENGNKELL
jgi:UDP-2,3-diacylglucosamine hydrolase